MTNNRIERDHLIILYQLEFRMSEEVTALRKSLGQLDVQRQSLEMEAEAIVSELTSKPENGGEPMGIDTPLVDREGYPRADIDLYRTRDLRHRLAVIRTDHKDLMKKIEGVLAQIAVLQVSIIL